MGGSALSLTFAAGPAESEKKKNPGGGGRGAGGNHCVTAKKTFEEKFQLHASLGLS